MFKISQFLIGLPVIIFSLYSCGGNPEKRPSPPASDTLALNGATINIEYSSPAVRERQIWGELVPYNEIWRTGANKATYLHTSDDILINGELLKAGSYGLFTIPGKETWQIIFNEEWDQWGCYNYDENKDLFRLTITPETDTNFQERMSFSFDENYLVFAWENLSFRLKVENY